MKQQDLTSQCIGITQAGVRCRRQVPQGEDRCQSHAEEHVEVVEFLKVHRGALAGFFAGAVADPVAGDLYDFLKESMGLAHLIPPIRVPREDLNPPGHDLEGDVRWRFHGDDAVAYLYYPAEEDKPATGVIILARGMPGNWAGPALVYHHAGGSHTYLGRITVPTSSPIEMDYAQAPPAICYRQTGWFDRFDRDAPKVETRYEFDGTKYVQVKP